MSDQGVRRAFIALSGANVVLVAMYVIADACQWGVLQGFYGCWVSVRWMLLQIDIAYGRRYDGAIADGMITIYNWSFTILLAIVVLDLAAIWRITRKSS